MKDWADEASCKTLVNANTVFFSSEEKDLRSLASQFCFSCPVQNQCLYTSMVLEEEYGLWGGLTPKQRKIFNKRISAIASSKGMQPSISNKDFDNLLFKSSNLEEVKKIIS
jgi:hypothetical protein